MKLQALQRFVVISIRRKGVWEPMLLLMQNHSSHLKRDKIQFILESNMSENGLGTQTKITINSMFQCGSRFMRHRNKTKKGMETLFKCIGGSIGDCYN